MLASRKLMPASDFSVSSCQAGKLGIGRRQENTASPGVLPQIDSLIALGNRTFLG